MKCSSLVTALALAVCSSLACSGSDNPRKPGRGGSGGQSGDGGSGGSGTGGSVGTGGSGGRGGTGGSVGTGGSGGSVGGSGGTAGTGGGGGTGGGTARDGGADATNGGSSGDARTDMAGGDGATSGGMLTITVDHVPDPARNRLCFRPSATNSMGNRSPKIDWMGIPPEAKSLVLTTEDLSNTPTVHQIICNIPVTYMGHPADAKGMVPMGAEAGYGHNDKAGAWYGPGAGLRNYEIKIWALATPTFEGGCRGVDAPARDAMRRLKSIANNKAVVLATASKVLWGAANGMGCP